MIDKSGKWWKGEDFADIVEYLGELTADGYQVNSVDETICGECGGRVLRLRRDPERGIARWTCDACGTKGYLSGDRHRTRKARYLTLACLCRGLTFQLGLGRAPGPDGETRWTTVGYRCTHCGILGAPVGWGAREDDAPTVWGSPDPADLEEPPPVRYQSTEIATFLDAEDEQELLDEIRRVRPNLTIRSYRGLTVDCLGESTDGQAFLSDAAIVGPFGVQIIQSRHWDTGFSKGRVACKWSRHDANQTAFVRDVMNAVRRVTADVIVRTDGVRYNIRIGRSAYDWAREPGHVLRDHRWSALEYRLVDPAKPFPKKPRSGPPPSDP